MDFLQVNGETHDEAPGERTARARTTAWILWIQEKPLAPGFPLIPMKNVVRT